MKHDVLLKNNIGNPIRFLEQRMSQWSLALALLREHIREIHEVAEIMDPSAR